MDFLILTHMLQGDLLDLVLAIQAAVWYGLMTVPILRGILARLREILQSRFACISSWLSDSLLGFSFEIIANTVKLQHHTHDVLPFLLGLVVLGRAVKGDAREVIRHSFATVSNTSDKD